MIEIDGSRYSGSGTLIRQALVFAALTGEAVHISNARVRRPKPGLRLQHVKVAEAIGQLVAGKTEGVARGSRDLTFWPGVIQGGAHYVWDIGSAGSTTLLALAVLPLVAFAPNPVRVELHGGTFQDFAPSVFHLEQVVLPLLSRMGLAAALELARPGYAPRGGGILRLAATPARGRLRAVVGDEPAPVKDLYGTALASHLKERGVARRMAQSALKILEAAGYQATVELEDDTTALQPGAALAVFANLVGGGRLGADCAGAPGRPSEMIGERVARLLLAELGAGATIDRFAADQIIPFAALAEGESRFRIAGPTDHIESNAWLAETFLGAKVEVRGPILSVRGVGFQVR